MLNFIQKRWPVEFPDALLEKARKQKQLENLLMDCVKADELDVALQDAFAENIVASYAIENEYLDAEAVKSLVIDSMGINVPDWECDDLKTSREAWAVRATLSLMKNNDLVHEDIFHAFSLLSGRKTSAYRDHPEIVKNGLGKIIYRAPEAEIVQPLMDRFIDWWNNERKKLPMPLGAAMAHYIFVSIHPFADGNGRMARALCDRAMIADRKTLFRPYSWSAAILEKRLDYYGSLRASTPEPFLRFMLATHELALQKGFQQAARFRLLEKIFRRMELDHEEKEMIAEMSKYPDAIWQPDDFFCIENPACVWERLREKGLINFDGKLETEEQEQKITPKYKNIFQKILL